MAANAKLLRLASFYYAAAIVIQFKILQILISSAKFFMTLWCLPRLIVKNVFDTAELLNA